VTDASVIVDEQTLEDETDGARPRETASSTKTVVRLCGRRSFTGMLMTSFSALGGRHRLLVHRRL
jgi:hypothetical protein